MGVKLGRSEMLGKSRKLKVLRMSSPIVEIVSGAATYVLHTHLEAPSGHIVKNPKIKKNGPVCVPMELPISP